MVEPWLGERSNDGAIPAGDETMAQNAKFDAILHKKLKSTRVAR